MTKVKVYKKDTTVKVLLKQDLIKQLQIVLLHLIDSFDKPDKLETLLNEKTITDSHVMSIKVMAHLIRSIDEFADKQGLLEEQEININNLNLP